MRKSTALYKDEQLYEDTNAARDSVVTHMNKFMDLTTALQKECERKEEKLAKKIRDLKRSEEHCDFLQRMLDRTRDELYESREQVRLLQITINELVPPPAWEDHPQNAVIEQEQNQDQDQDGDKRSTIGGTR